jgi:hypothetical protein
MMTDSIEKKKMMMMSPLFKFDYTLQRELYNNNNNNNNLAIMLTVF